MPGPAAEIASEGLSVDRSSRADVVSFYQHVYQASVGAEDNLGWTGNLGLNGQTRRAGRTSAQFQKSMERRLNYYRALAGLANIELAQDELIRTGLFPNEQPANPSVSRERAAQENGLMMALSNRLSHDPARNTPGYTNEAWNAAAYGNLTLNITGPPAIDSYMEEPRQFIRDQNDVIGHRRWLLYPRVTQMATGDTPQIRSGGRTYGATNTLYVIGSFLPFDQRPAPQFVNWPSEGFFPEPHTPDVWSTTYSGADFRQASVRVVGQDGRQFPVEVIFRSNNPVQERDAAIGWVINRALPDVQSADYTYDVTISNIRINGRTVTHRYQTTFINPDRTEQSLELMGNPNPARDGANFYFEQGDLLGDYELQAFQTLPTSFSEGAEEPASATLVDKAPSSNYNARSDVGFGFASFVGSSCWRLCHGWQDEVGGEITLTLRGSFDLGQNSQLRFYARRGFMVSGAEEARVEFSRNGVDWETVPGSIIPARTDNQVDPEFQAYSISLPATNQPVQLRFRYGVVEGTDLTRVGIFTVGASDDGSPIGLYIDEIELLNVTEKNVLFSAEPSSDADFVRLSASQLKQIEQASGDVALSLVAKVGDANFRSEQSFPVTPGRRVSGFDFWKLNEFATIGTRADDDDGDGLPNSLEYAFSSNPLAATSASGLGELRFEGGMLELCRPLEGSLRSGLSYRAEWSDDLQNWTPVPAFVSDGCIRARIPNEGQSALSFRWRVDGV